MFLCDFFTFCVFNVGKNISNPQIVKIPNTAHTKKRQELNLNVYDYKNRDCEGNMPCGQNTKSNMMLKIVNNTALTRVIRP